MAQIPTPSRGQPLDVTYISQIVTALNEVSTKVSSATYRYTTVYKRDGGSQDISNDSARIIAGYAQILNNEPVQQVDFVKTYTFTYPTDFLYAPIVTATVQNLGGNSVGDNVTVTVRNVTTSGAELAVRFGKTGTANVAVNLIIFGIPKSTTV